MNEEDKQEIENLKNGNALLIMTIYKRVRRNSLNDDNGNIAPCMYDQDLVEMLIVAKALRKVSKGIYKPCIDEYEQRYQELDKKVNNLFVGKRSSK